MAVHTVYIVFVVSFGWFFFLAFCLLAMWYLLTRRTEKKMQEAEVIRCDEHVRVKEDIMKGPMGAETIALSIEKDDNFEEDFIKKEKELKGKHMHYADTEKGASSTSN
ncbi:hypothetical protein SASPL_133577 [Salvia splendens]|uniref:Uncharacterized protein n=1 Tax=Salvia splendens TaxID=180675 RepID=A0A8X8X2Y6_SALSN|nr:hypothetical protein SASPL_133577 [Salvia splendens]